MLEAIEEFLADLRVEGRGKLTLEGHERHLKRLAAWYVDNGLDWQTVNRKQLQPYVRLWGERAASTRANLHTSLRTFYRWAVEEGYVAMSPAAHLKTPRRPQALPQSLTKDQIRRLVEYLQKLQGRTALRDRTLILTGLYAGLRACELAALRWSMVDHAGQVINIRLSKMNHGRTVPIHPQLAEELMTWSKIQNLVGDDVPVFSLDGVPIVSERAGKICREHSKALRVPFHTHSLRHTFATMMYRLSGNIYAVSKALGHLDIRQTQVYLSANIEDIRDALGGLPRLEDW